MKNLFLLNVCLLILTSCEGLLKTEEEKAGAEATAFATAYFNFKYQTAKEYVTEESEKWIVFAASNVTQADLDVINAEEPAEVELLQSYLETDTTAVSVLNVTNYLSLDSVEGSVRHVEQGEFLIPLVKRDGRWKVRMANLLQSETPNHD